MSGGHYQYGYSRLNDLADQIDADLANDELVEQNSDIENFKYDLEFVSERIKLLAEASRNIEWLLSGDYGVETYEATMREFYIKWYELPS